MKLLDHLINRLGVVRYYKNMDAIPKHVHGLKTAEEYFHICIGKFGHLTVNNYLDDGDLRPGPTVHDFYERYEHTLLATYVQAKKNFKFWRPTDLTHFSFAKVQGKCQTPYNQFLTKK